MLGTKFYKDNYDLETYSACAEWCNTTQQGYIVDKGEYYECVVIPPPPPPTIDELKQGLINAVQTYMDETAQTRGYDSIASACSYGLSTVQKFREEAVACISWRDNVWNYCYEQLALFENGERDVPTVEQLIAELPTLDW